ncbi:hypothetical protein [Bacteroides togonis]|uniref:hypothetical protein n=1 Tax=Bacteroides togonis TaxID=1917883 RepID=UPI00094B7013|nr:hypothetical protein [Bacteroides togonis]
MAGFFQGLGQVITGLGQIAWSILKTACLAVALIVYGVYSLAKEGLSWASKQYQKFGSKFKKQKTIDPTISRKLKEFLDGQPITVGEKLKLSSDVKNSNTITRIAQDENGDALAFEFVKVNGGCDFTGIVEQEVE